MRHPGRVPSDNVKRRSRTHPRLRVPLNLSRACVHHRRGEDGEDGGRGVQHAVLENRLMLLDAGGQRHVVVLSPAPQRVEEQDGLLVAALQETTLGVLSGGGGGYRVSQKYHLSSH